MTIDIGPTMPVLKSHYQYVRTIRGKLHISTSEPFVSQALCGVNFYDSPEEPTKQNLCSTCRKVYQDRLMEGKHE